jgi:hypothetical protein
MLVSAIWNEDSYWYVRQILTNFSDHLSYYDNTRTNELPVTQCKRSHKKQDSAKISECFVKINKQKHVASTFTRSESEWILLVDMLKDDLYRSNRCTESDQQQQNIDAVLSWIASTEISREINNVHFKCTSV